MTRNRITPLNNSDQVWDVSRFEVKLPLSGWVKFEFHGRKFGYASIYWFNYGGLFELGKLSGRENEMSNKMRIAQPEKNKNMRIQEIPTTISSPDTFEHDYTNDDRQQVLKRKGL